MTASSTQSVNEMLERWFADCSGFVHVCRKGNFVGTFLEIPPCSPQDPWRPHLTGLKESTDFYFSVYTFESARRGRDNVKHIPGIWADLDFRRFEGGREEADERLSNLPLMPSILVYSGGGYHFYLKFSEPQAHSEDVSNLLKTVTAVLGGDPATTHYAALLRIPGTLNSKYEQTRVEIDLRSSWENYSFQQALSFARESGLLVGGSNQENRSRIPREAVLPNPLSTVPEKFHTLLGEDQNVLKTWKRIRPDLRDQSRSAYDFSMTNMLVNQGYTDSEILTILAQMPAGREKDGTIEYFMHGINKVRRERESDRQIVERWKARRLRK